MIRATVRLAVAGVCVWGVLAGIARTAEPRAAVLRWQPDLPAAHAVAVREGKPMLLVFGASWCTWCKKLEQTTLADPKMVTFINSAFVPVHIDVDEHKKVAQILEVESLPCMVVLSPAADLLGRFEGFETPDSLYKKLVAARELQSRIAPASGSTTP